MYVALHYSFTPKDLSFRSRRRRNSSGDAINYDTLQTLGSWCAHRRPTVKDYQSYYKGKRVLVTGGAGAIGSNLTRELAALDAELIIVLDDFSAAYSWNVPSIGNVLCVRG